MAYTITNCHLAASLSHLYTRHIRLNELHSVSNIFTFNKGYMTTAMKFGSHYRDNNHNYLSIVILIIMIIIIRMYTLVMFVFQAI